MKVLSCGVNFVTPSYLRLRWLYNTLGYLLAATNRNLLELA